MEFASASERLEVRVSTPQHDFAGVRTDIRVDRWDEEQVAWTHRKLGLVPSRELLPRHFAQAGVKPYLITVERNCNVITLAGWTALLGGIAGTSITNKFSATAGRIGVGTSSTSAVSTQTWLQGDSGSGSTTSYYQLCGAAPAISTAQTPATLTFTATFGTTVANFSWQEFGTDNYTASGVTTQGLGAADIFFNRGVSNQGSKVSGQIWTATETLVFGFPSASGAVI